MSNKWMTMLLVGALALSASACDNKKTDGGDTSATSAPADTTGETAGETTGAADTPEEPEEADGEVAAADFGGKLVPAACTAITTCKNEELSAAIGGGLTMVAALTAMGDEEFAASMKELEKEKAGDEDARITEKQCTIMTTGIIKFGGMDGETLAGKVGETVDYDAKKAAECIAAIEKVPACETEKKLEGELKMDKVDGIMKESGIEAHLAECEQVFEGKVAEGEACSFDYECMGEDVSCKAEDPKKEDSPTKCTKRPA